MDDSGNPAKEVAERFCRWETVDAIVHSPAVQNMLVGRSPAFIELLRQVVEVAKFTNASVLIMGESGTGKELVARLIHGLDSRPTKRNLVPSTAQPLSRSCLAVNFSGTSAALSQAL